MKLFAGIAALGGANGIYLSEFDRNGTLQFDPETNFYKRYKHEIKLGASTCMTSGQIDLQNGSKGTFPGVLWQDQTSGGQIVDYEKCVYVFTLANAIDHAAANKMCESSLVQPTSACPDCKGTLVSIHNKETNDFITNAIVNDPNNPGWPHWIGLRQYCRSCPFEWDDHSPVTYQNWAPGEPNNWGDGEDCVEMWLDEGSRGTWNDHFCTNHNEYVCQIYTTTDHPKIELDKMWPEGNCRAGWWKMGKACYRVFGSKHNNDPNPVDTKTWQEANSYCAQAWTGATLAVLPNIHYQYYIGALVRNIGHNAWIGGLRTTSDLTYHWLDGTRMTYSFWKAGEPNNWDDNEDKVQVYSYSDNQFNSQDPGQWNDQWEGERHAFICSHKQDMSLKEEKPNPNCPDGWVAAPQMKNFCYKLVTTQDTNFDGAQTYCKGLEKSDGVPMSNLVSIEDIYEDNFVASLLYSKETNYDPTFGGLRKGVWIGLSGAKSVEDGKEHIRWNWQDEFPVSFTRWGLNQPNLNDVNTAPAKSCVYIDKDRNWFVNAGCNLQQSFVCKANFGPKPERPSDDRGDYLDCPGGWSDDGQTIYCLKAFSQEKSWFEADAICKANFGSRLTSIHSESFNDRVKSVFLNRTPLPGMTKTSYWIGLSRNNDGGLEWTDGSIMSYANWAPGEPSETWNGEAEDCVNVYNTGKWNDDTCSEKFPFVCRHPRPRSNCIDIPELEKTQCGYPGISESVCMQDLKCCYSGADVAGISCYNPKGRKSGGMSPGGAAALTSFIWIALFGGFIVYYTMFMGSTTGSVGFSNPMA